MVTAVPGSKRRSVVTQPALPAVREGVIVTAFAAASDSSEVSRVALEAHSVLHLITELQLASH